MVPKFKTLLIQRVASNSRISRIILNRPEKLNAINDEMPGEIKEAVEWANDDRETHVIVVEGAGKGFCGGYDCSTYAEGKDGHPCMQKEHIWDPSIDYRYMKKATDCIMSLWHSSKPTIAKVHGYAAAGGSDIALCCDLLVMAENARMATCPQGFGAVLLLPCGRID